MSWTDERVEILKRMWGEGQSASQIAKELGGVTRNAVIGKVHRLGLSNRTQPAARGGDAATKAAPAASAAKPKEPKPAAATKPVANTPKPPAQEPPAAKPAPAAAKAAPAAPSPEPAPAPVARPPVPMRKPIVPAGQPLPPQPSPNEISPEALASQREAEKQAKKLSLMELTERTCKWPIGDPATEEFWFCGLPVQAGKPYCEAHVNVAFQPMSSRRDRKR
ncbi:MAG: GcrA cell cycle regulator [Mangrovicoccus sp.]|nr:GcrA cell cycle regulator [Mangrovicoccus sp.]